MEHVRQFIKTVLAIALGFAITAVLLAVTATAQKPAYKVKGTAEHTHTYTGQGARDRVERLKREDPDWKVGYEAEMLSLLAAGYDVDSPYAVVEDTKVTEYEVDLQARGVVQRVRDALMTPAYAATYTQSTSTGISTLTPFEKDGLDTTEANFYSKWYPKNLRSGTNMQFRNNVAPLSNQMSNQWALTLQFAVDQPAIGCPMGYYDGTRCDFRTTSGWQALNSKLGKNIFTGTTIDTCAGSGFVGAFTGKNWWTLAGGCGGMFAYQAVKQWVRLSYACFNSMRMCDFVGQRCCLRVY